MRSGPILRYGLPLPNRVAYHYTETSNLQQKKNSEFQLGKIPESSVLPQENAIISTSNHLENLCAVTKTPAI
jgi:hypothetical protein